MRFKEVTYGLWRPVSLASSLTLFLSLCVSHLSRVFVLSFLRLYVSYFPPSLLHALLSFLSQRSLPLSFIRWRRKVKER